MKTVKRNYLEVWLSYNHIGEPCWVNGLLCLKNGCLKCQIYLNWKRDREEEAELWE